MNSLAVDAYRSKLYNFSNPKNADSNLVFEFCKLIRINQLKEYRTISRYGIEVVKKDLSSKYGDEWYLFVEQVCIALMHSNKLDDAKFCLDLLGKKFGEQKSTRYRLLTGLYQESQGNFDIAKKIYLDILNENQTYTNCYKRLISISKSRESVGTTIQLLNEYLSVLMSDSEAWLELADLYLSLSDYKNAAYCLEELLILNPQIYHYYVKYAEVLYTIGGTKNFILARKNFSFALELSSENNLRAIWGLALASQAVENAKLTNTKDPKINKLLFSFSSELIENEYANSVPKIRDAAKEALAELTFTSKCF